MRQIKCQHPDNVADKILECQLCHAKLKCIDNLIFHKRTCELIIGSVPKRQQNTHAKWSEQLLQHNTDKFIINLDVVQQTSDAIIDIFRNSIMDMKPAILSKGALKRYKIYHITQR